MKSVILAGGLGTRLRPYTIFLPKPMLPLGEKPILEHLIEWNKDNGIESIVLCVSYLRDTILNHFGDGSKFGVGIEYAISSKPLSTAGQLKTAEGLIDDTFVCMYGDSLFDFDLGEMVARHRHRNAFVTMGLSEHRTTLPYGVIDTSESGDVLDWREKPETSANINMGCYVMEAGVFEMIPRDRQYGMDDLVKDIMGQKRTVSSFLARNGFVDIGDKASYEAADNEYIRKIGKI